MAQVGKVKDFMVDIFDYPHLPEWFTIRQAIGIVKASAAADKKTPAPMTMLVFDEKYCLLGTMGLREILKGIEPQGSDDARSMAERPVRDVMLPAKYTVGPEDSVAKAAQLMIWGGVSLLPVLEDAKKFVGLVRLEDLFDVLSGHVMAG